MKKLVLLLLPLVIFACKKDEKSEEPTEFNQSKMLGAIYSSTIQPQLEQLKASSLLFSAETKKYLADSSNAQREVTQEAFKKFNEAFAAYKIANVGPVKSKYVFELMDVWPTDTTVIGDFVNHTPALVQVDLKKRGFSIRGFAALDYLLFANSANQTSQTRKLIYWISQGLNERITDVENLWNDGYEKQFTKGNSSETGEALSQLVNGVITSLETMKYKELFLPFKGKFGKVTVTDTRAPYSLNSLKLIKAQLTTIEAIHNGNGSTGIAHNLKQLNAMYNNKPLHEAISEKIKSALDKTEVISDNLESAFTASPQQVQELHDAIKEVLVLYKNDVASSLSIVVTFSDNDGD